ncbi:hypothetical protein ONZ45_g9882 [Pleurotus djamor]|nr:hypothetical protein ONZ45_g9882 [Pleurotus djamor]
MFRPVNYICLESFSIPSPMTSVIRVHLVSDSCETVGGFIQEIESSLEQQPIEVYKIDPPIHHSHIDRDSLNHFIELLSGPFALKQRLTPPDPQELLSAHIGSQPDRALSYFLIAYGRKTPRPKSDLRRAFGSIFVTVSHSGQFHPRDLELSDVEEADGDEPLFVKEFETKLHRKPLLAHADENLASEGIQDSLHRDAYFEASPQQSSVSSNMDIDVNAASEPIEQKRTASRVEVLHVVSLATVSWSNIWNHGGLPLKEHVATSMLFNGNLIQVIHETTQLEPQFGNAAWPFHVIARHEDDVSPNGKVYSFRPKSDFSLMLSGLPVHFVETNSSPARPRDSLPFDLIRLLLSGSFVVRFANGFLPMYSKDKDFVLPLFYIRADGKVDRHIMFQKLEDKDKMNSVYYTHKRFNVNEVIPRLEVVLNLYNLVSILGQVEGQDVKARRHIRALKNSIDSFKQHQPANFANFCPPTSGTKGKSEKDGKGVKGGNTDDLIAHGYEVDEIVSETGEMMPYMRPTPHVFRVQKQSCHGKVFIAKKTSAHEIQILRAIESLAASYDSFLLPVETFGSWIVLPQLPYTLNAYLSLPSNEVVKRGPYICWDIIAALSYLHIDLRIAHRDIKPSNVVLDGVTRTKLIDFDIAIQVSDENEEVADLRGTSGWMAPEIGQHTTHSPIKADRWACGRLIRYVLSNLQINDQRLSSIANDLVKVNPSDRPSLVKFLGVKAEDMIPPELVRSLSSDEPVSVGPTDFELLEPPTTVSRRYT